MSVKQGRVRRQGLKFGYAECEPQRAKSAEGFLEKGSELHPTRNLLHFGI